MAIAGALALAYTYVAVASAREAKLLATRYVPGSSQGVGIAFV